MTAYLVFQKTTDDAWAQVGPDRVEASTSRAAITAALKNRDAEGSFVAIPERSFRPVTVKVETKTALRFS